MNTTVIILVAVFLILFSVCLTTCVWILYEERGKEEISFFLLNILITIITIVCMVLSCITMMNISNYLSGINRIEKSTPKITDVPERANFDTLLTIHNGDTIITSFPIVWNDDIDINNNKN